MNNTKQSLYNAVSHLKRSVMNFGAKISKGLSKPKIRFVSEMLYGMMVAQDVKLTKIAAALKEDMPLKYTEERLRRNLAAFENGEVVQENYLAEVVKKCQENTVLIIDGGDISKPYGSKFEGLCRVRDGSTGRIEKGFPTVGMIALTDDKLPLPVYEKIFSYDKDFVSENDETFQALDFAAQHFSPDNIRVFDRGYDSSIVTQKLVDSGVKFIVRAVGNRRVEHHGETLSILEISKKFEGKYALTYENQKGKKVDCKVWITPIEMNGNALNLVICNGFGEKPLMLVTNVFNDEKICTTIVKCYLLRWKIEEFYRFKKQTFNFEDMRVMSLNGMNNINQLLNILIGFLAMKSTGSADKPVIVTLINHVKRIFSPKNVLYSLCAGIYAAFAMVGSGLSGFF